jgi:S-adenosylmethionine:tRNA ribosyltransferase-isomerase
MKTSDFDYELPSKFIAQTPVEPRDASRLLILDKEHNTLEHSKFNQLGDYLLPGDLLVLNQTRVIPARLFAKKIPTGGRVEILLIRELEDSSWETLVGGKGLVPGKRLQVESGPTAEIISELEGPRRIIRFDSSIELYLNDAGHVPLPPYIHTTLENPERYQTVYAREAGSVAAPTAGLHFTPQLIAQLIDLGVRFTQLTLHVGLDTFAPVTEETPLKHQIHTEWFRITRPAAEVINRTRQSGGRVFAVGTTSVRALESAVQILDDEEIVTAYEGPTDLFILPGYSFKIVDALITNFHLPRSSLIMLVSAFAGRKRILNAYQTAIENNYRFYSFGDAMLIL